MKIRAHIPALLALSLALTLEVPAFAQGDGDLVAQEKARRQVERAMRRAERQRDLGFDRRYYDERGAGPDRQFRRGDRLPPEWRSRSYVVEDWRGHRLTAPPAGYQWVQVGGDYVLVARGSGVIRQLRLHD